MPRTEQSGLKTGSVTSFSTCGSSILDFITSRCPFGPFDWILYCQKYFSFFEHLWPSSSSSESVNRLVVDTCQSCLRDTYCCPTSSPRTVRRCPRRSRTRRASSPAARDSKSPLWITTKWSRTRPMNCLKQVKADLVNKLRETHLVDSKCFRGSRLCHNCSRPRWVGAEEDSLEAWFLDNFWLLGECRAFRFNGTDWPGER